MGYVIGDVVFNIMIMSNFRKYMCRRFFIVLFIKFYLYFVIKVIVIFDVGFGCWFLVLRLFWFY